MASEGEGDPIGVSGLFGGKMMVTQCISLGTSHRVRMAGPCLSGRSRANPIEGKCGVSGPCARI